VTRELGSRLLNALDVDILLLKGGVHGIETDNLPYGILDGEITHGSGNGEVLQLVKDEMYLVVVLSIVDPDERVG
jgi:hypothetical protein